MTYKNIILSALMIITIGLAAWTTLSYRPQNQTISTVAELPDAYMENVTAVVLNKQGRLNMKIKTPNMVHYSNGDITQLTSPQLTLYRKSPQPWYITSKFAKASQGIENIHFREDVSIHHAADFNNPATLIKTATLTVHPNQETAETKDPITMTQQDLIIRAIGMKADMNTGEIKLLSQTRGEYEPNS